MLHTKFHQNWFAVLGKKCFYLMQAWQPSWSCDQHHVDEFSRIFINSISFRAQAAIISAIVSKIIHFLHFFLQESQSYQI